MTATSAAGSGSSRRARRPTTAASTGTRPVGATEGGPPAEVQGPSPMETLPVTPEPLEPLHQQVPPAFAHASEAEMARILNFYQVRWEYEPHTFPIQWNVEGDVVESFSPDFWLPDLGLYLEMTTLRQKLVRKKNRKLRRVLELYPDLRVKLFYARDFRALMLKFGKLALADALSGTLGQVVPERPAVAVDVDSAVPPDPEP